ncbi:RNA pseudouridylate synthase [Nitzschia inconspicua]|uniref:RNA pseudouridylate synthase n=1 Tax=Nitzschia inconspicua TaxID=303405 RepID=A0A9K3LQL6_9STRA|nr:RNA pseudouridylate synthase [Nitzschia inconspicua]
MSRREADRLILAGRVLLDGKQAEIGEKVPLDLLANRIAIRPTTTEESGDPNRIVSTDTTESFPAVVLNKPLGYVSGQSEHDNVPAIRLLKPNNLWTNNDPHLSNIELPRSWRGFAPAGRLDKDSTGLLVFSRSGVLAKKIISADSVVEKEYLVNVSPAVQASRREVQLRPSFNLPRPTLDLSPLLRGGGSLLGDEDKKDSRLKPCVDAEWIRSGEILRIVLTEGKKRHIRRVCRELTGWHVTALQRIRIGPIKLENMPEGDWRPLRQNEIEELLNNY